MKGNWYRSCSNFSISNRRAPVCKCDEIPQNFLWLNTDLIRNSRVHLSTVALGSKILVTWFKLIYWGRARLNSASFPEWVWQTLKLTVKRFKGLSYLCFKRLSRTDFYDHHIVPNYTCSPSSRSVCQPSIPLQSVSLMELLQTDGSPLLDRGEQLPNCICETVFHKKTYI